MSTAANVSTADSQALLKVSGLTKSFVRTDWLGRKHANVHAVADVSFSVQKGRTLGLVGESGSGKSTTGRLVLRLIEADAGEILFNGCDIRAASPKTMRKLRRDIQFIFQDPYSSLNPRLSVRSIIEEGLIVQGYTNRSEREDRIAAILRRVGIRPELMQRFANEFSGGQRQRIGIARALVVRPKLVVADEPVSALDVSIQAQVLNLMTELQQEFDLTMIFIAHDIAAVEHMSEEIAVMYRGRIVEQGSSEQIIGAPQHPYTQSLIAAVPRMVPMRPG